MSNLIDYFKDKIYYVLGATIVIILLIIILGSCSSGGNSYSKIEDKMVNAAEKYYYENKNRLPKEDGNSVRLSIGTMVDKELIKEIKDPSDKENICNGYVEVTKVGKKYSYVPLLTCKGNYEPKYLVDVIKKSKIDEYGNGLYNENGEYVYKGANVKNYVDFNNQLWRIVKIDNAGDIKLVAANSLEEPCVWDGAYNSEKEEVVGRNTNYSTSSIRKTLNDYYKKNFDVDSKAKIVAKNLCVGMYSENDSFSVEKECLSIKENEKISLLNASDYQKSSLDSSCTHLNSRECINYNYLADDDSFYTWISNGISDNTYTSLYLMNTLETSYSSDERGINPVVYLTNKVIILEGKGTKSSPYVIK